MNRKRMNALILALIVGVGLVSELNAWRGGRGHGGRGGGWGWRHGGGWGRHHRWGRGRGGYWGAGVGLGAAGLWFGFGPSSWAWRYRDNSDWLWLENYPGWDLDRLIAHLQNRLAVEPNPVIRARIRHRLARLYAVQGY